MEFLGKSTAYLLVTEPVDKTILQSKNFKGDISEYHFNFNIHRKVKNTIIPMYTNPGTPR